MNEITLMGRHFTPESKTSRAGRFKCLAAAVLAIALIALACAMASASRLHARRIHEYAHQSPLRAGQMHWGRILVTSAAPSKVFATLGLTHMTRHGYTRDGQRKGKPDPGFPPGLTDVVPFDADHVFLARGTAQGLAAFRARVDAAAAQLAALPATAAPATATVPAPAAPAPTAPAPTAAP